MEPGMLRRFHLRRMSIGCLTAALLCAGVLSCGSNPGGRDGLKPKEDANLSDGQQLMPDEVRAIMQSAAHAIDADMAVAVADRRGVILGVGTKAKHGSDFTLDYQCQC